MILNSDELIKYIIIGISSLITIFFAINFVVLFRSEWSKYDEKKGSDGKADSQM